VTGRRLVSFPAFCRPLHDATIFSFLHSMLLLLFNIGPRAFLNTISAGCDIRRVVGVGRVGLWAPHDIGVGGLDFFHPAEREEGASGASLLGAHLAHRQISMKWARWGVAR
jgi:hypothetical protein